MSEAGFLLGTNRPRPGRLSGSWVAHAVQLKNCQTRTLSDPRLLATPHLQLSPLPSSFASKSWRPKHFSVIPWPRPPPGYWGTIICFSLFLRHYGNHKDFLLPYFTDDLWFWVVLFSPRTHWKSAGFSYHLFNFHVYYEFDLRKYCVLCFENVIKKKQKVILGAKNYFSFQLDTLYIAPNMWVISNSILKWAKTWIDISQRKIYKWPTSTGEDFPNY